MLGPAGRAVLCVEAEFEEELTLVGTEESGSSGISLPPKLESCAHLRGGSKIRA